MKARHTALTALGRNIRKRREGYDLSQEELADKAELDRTYIGGVERGERNLTILSAIKIARALEINVSELCRGIDK
jgi:transcriptional regulator with XRE-family HTH domain